MVQTAGRITTVVEQDPSIRWSINFIRPDIAASHRRCVDFDRKASFLIAFVPPAKGIPVYEAVEADSCKMLFSDPLEKLAGDDTSKRKLWNGLKAMFSA